MKTKIKASILKLSLAFLSLLVPGLAAAQNLIVNGDFETGNTSFSSDYIYTPTVNNDEGQYTVRTNPFPWNGAFITSGDHTSGTGNMFVGNGNPVPNSIIWETTSVSVTPNTDYFFEVWVMNVCCTEVYTGPNSPAVLEFSVAGAATESLGVINTSFPAGVWLFLSATWNSGANTSVDLRIINQNTAVGGNDFALDDIYFATESSSPFPEYSVPVPIWALLGLGLTVIGVALKRLHQKDRS